MQKNQFIKYKNEYQSNFYINYELFIKNKTLIALFRKLYIFYQLITKLLNYSLIKLINK